LTVLQVEALAEFELPFDTLRMTPTMITGTATMAKPRAVRIVRRRLSIRSSISRRVSRLRR